MQSWEREYHVARIVAGKTRIRWGRVVLYVVGNTREQKYRAAEIYRDARSDAEYDGALSETDLMDILQKNGIWTTDRESESKAVADDIENGKVGLFENRLRSNAKLTIRTTLKKLRERQRELEHIRHCMDHITIDGLAATARFRYLVATSLRGEDGQPYYDADGVVDAVVEKLAAQRLAEADFRDIARNEPWKSLWGTREAMGDGLFGVASTDATDDQRNLTIWSLIYDNIKEYPDAPADDIIVDDDMLDGWMIIQRRKRENQAASQQANAIGNARIRDSDEIFVVADTVDDAREIEKMNDVVAQSAKRERMAHLKRQGVVSEAAMPDQARRIQMEFNQLEAAKLRQMRGK